MAAHTMAMYVLWLCLLQALLGLVRRGIGVDEAQIQDLASNLADNLEAYRTLSDQIEKALVRRPAPPRAAPRRSHAAATLGTLPLRTQVAYRKTTEGAGHVAQVRQPHAPGCSLQDTRAGTHSYTSASTPASRGQVARKLATNLTANKQSDFATDAARAHASDTVYHRVFKLLSQVRVRSH
jgi:hypothetical protein